MAIELLQSLAQHANYLKMIHKCISQGAEHCRCTTHRDCRFGQWFYDAGIRQIAALEDAEIQRLWDEIKKNHILFHQLSFDLVEKSHAADGIPSRAAAEDETKMMQCSTIMVNRLLELVALLSKRAHHHHLAWKDAY